MPRCSFCSEDIQKGTGKMFVKKDGKILYFCSSKCQRNTFKLRRKPLTTRWTKEFERVKESTKKQ